MSRPTQNRIAAAIGSRARQIGRAMIIVGAVSATALPTAASARGINTGAAIGLGVLGGVLAGAAIAASAPPYYGYGAPPPAYGYPPQPWPGYDYAPAPAYYPAPQPYYGWGPYR
jgi:hypothetical protein